MRKISLAVIIFALLGGACRDGFLTVVPQNGSITDAEFFQTTEHFDSFIFGMYTEMQGVADQISVPGSLMQDIATDNNQANLPVFMNPNNGVFYDKFWQVYFNIAARANLVLEKLPQAPDETRGRIEGEAHFMRGFAYFNLARCFGSVPLLLESYRPSQDVATCAPEAEVWNQVVKDLTVAAAKLPTVAGWGAQNLGRVTKGTAFAYLANAQMYLKKWPEALKATSDLDALGEFGLMPNVRDPFSRFKENSMESIFEIQFREDNNFNWGGNYNKGTLMPKLTAPGDADRNFAPGGGWGSFSFTRKYADSFEPGDARRRELVLMASEKYKGEDMKDTFKMPGVFSEAKNAFSTKYWRGPQLGPSDLLNPQNIPIMRYAEVLLNHAEILFETGNAMLAYQKLNAVRNRAKLADKPVSTDREVFFRDLMRERRSELGMEPNIYFHFVRTQRLAPFLKSEYNIDFDPNWTRFPIPQRDRNQNPNLCQNPGYR